MSYKAYDERQRVVVLLQSSLNSISALLFTSSFLPHLHHADCASAALWSPLQCSSSDYLADTNLRAHSRYRASPNPFRSLDEATKETTTTLDRAQIRNGLIGGYATSLIGTSRLKSLRCQELGSRFILYLV